MSYSIQIRIKPYLKEYLNCRANYMNDRSGLHSFVQLIIKPLLQKIPKDKVITPLRGDDVFTFDLRRMDDFDLRSHNYYISEYNQKIFQRTIRQHFIQILLSYTRDKLRSGKNLKEAILCFCADYSIQFDKTNYETLQKIIYRAQKKQKKNA